ncbi:MAG: heterodisulfide reductase-related iron-sulfur binding cluster [Halobacteriota archaeon]|nr:heterodisulfide reductase-related iron-sulfur binding cluster [Halobacteriota archaeon]
MKSKSEILDDPRAPNFYACIQCGACTSICPAAHAFYVDKEFSEEYNPRRIIQELILNKGVGVNGYPIDKCFHCYSCKSVCIKKNSVSDIVKILRESNDTESEYKDLLYKSFYEKGLSVTLSTYSDGFDDWIGFEDIIKDMGRIRSDIGLEAVHRAIPSESLHEIRKIADLTKNKKFIKTKELGRPKKTIPEDKLYLFKSCIMDAHYPGVTPSIKYIFDRLDVDYLDDPNQSTCTGFPYYADAVPFSTMLAINARNFAKAEESGYTNISPVCVTSYGVLTEAKEILESGVRGEVNEVLHEVGLHLKGDINVSHISETFYRLKSRIKEMIEFDCDGLKVATHSGCHYTKMFKESAIPNLLDELISVTCTKPVYYTEKNLCCGMGFKHALENRDLSRSVATRKLRSIKDSGADIVIYSCPGCQVTLDRNQRYIEEKTGEEFDFVHMNYAELIAILMGADPYKTVGIQAHSIPVEPILERLKIL